MMAGIGRFSMVAATRVGQNIQLRLLVITLCDNFNSPTNAVQLRHTMTTCYRKRERNQLHANSY